MKPTIFPRLVFLLLFCFTTVSLVSGAKKRETPAIPWSKNIKTPNFQNFNIIKVDSSVLVGTSYKVINEEKYVFHQLLEKPYVVVYNKKTGQTTSIRIDLKNGTTERSFVQTIWFNNVLHIVSSFTNLDQKKYYVFDETFNLDSLKLNNDTKKIAELDYGSLENASKSSLSTDVKIVLDRLLVTTEIRYKEGQLNLFNVFDASMSNKASFRYTYDGKKLVKDRALLDHSDNLYVLIYNATNKKTPSYDVHYFSSRDSTHRIKSFNEIFVTGTPVATVNKNNELVVAGFYSRPEQVTALGVFSLRFAANLEGTGNLLMHDFNDNFLTAGMDKQEASELLKALKQGKDYYNRYSYLSDSIHMQENGDFSFMCEMFAKDAIMSGGAQQVALAGGGSTTTGGGRMKQVSIFGNILAFNFSQNGELKWSQNIARKNELYDDNRIYGHYLSTIDKNNTINILLTSYRPTKSILKKLFFPNRMDIDKINRVRIDSTGKRTDEQLFSDSYTVKKFMPSYSKILEDGTCYLVRLVANPIKTTYNIGEYKLSLAPKP